MHFTAKHTPKWSANKRSLLVSLANHGGMAAGKHHDHDHDHDHIQHEHDHNHPAQPSWPRPRPGLLVPSTNHDHQPPTPPTPATNVHRSTHRPRAPPASGCRLPRSWTSSASSYATCPRASWPRPGSAWASLPTAPPECPARCARWCRRGVTGESQFMRKRPGQGAYAFFRRACSLKHYEHNDPDGDDGNNTDTATAAPTATTATRPLATAMATVARTACVPGGWG